MNILILGASGYLGRALERHLKRIPGNRVYCIDKDTVNLKNLAQCKRLFKHIRCEEIYQLAADSGGIDYLLSDEYSYGNSTLINLSIIKALKSIDFKGRILFPSSFYTANVENRYGLEKLYNEALYLQSGLDVRIPTLFSVYGPGEKLNSPQEKVTTAFCRRVIEKKFGEDILIHGHPFQTRYFLHIDDAIRGLVAHMKSDVIECDLAGAESITFERLINEVIKTSEKDMEVLWTRHGEMGVGYYPTPNKLEWKPRIKFNYGINRLYKWVENELS